MSSPQPAPPPPHAPLRILDAAARRIRAAGVAGASLQEIAGEAGVSKGLVLYHFRDKERLLAALVERTVEQLVARERALTAERPPAAEVVQALWEWVSAELARGELRVLLQLTAHPEALVAQAARVAARRRREQAVLTVEWLFGALELRPRVPVALVADVVVAFLDGLALDVTLGDREPRVAFDVFWLGVLSLAE